MTRFTTVACLIVFNGLAYGTQSDERVPIGIVDNVRGIWTRPQDGAGRQSLRAGDLMHEGHSVFTEHSTSNAISIVLFTTGQVWQKTCSTQEPCEGSYRLPAAAARNTGFWAFLSQYWTTKRAFPPIFAASRAAGGSGPRHSVIRAADGGVDFSPVIEGMGPGQYKLGVIGAPGSTSESRSRIELSVRQGDTGSLKANVPPGLYVVTLTDEKEQAIGSSAAVLIVNEGFAAAQQTWNAAQKEAAAWTGVALTTIDSVLVRTLYTLDAEHNQR